MPITQQESSSKFNNRVQAVQDFFHEQRRLPSYSEMLSLFSVRSKQAVARVVEKMLDAGVVEKDDSGRLRPGAILAGVRMLGSVQAGWPSPAEEELADVVTLDDYLIENKQATFMLRVSGESMLDAGIHPDDYVLVERGRTPRLNEIVIARVDTEYTLKYYQKEQGRIVLMPANDAFEPIRLESGEEATIEGVVVSVIRKY